MHTMCNCQATLQSSLNAHKDAIHEGVQYLCIMFSTCVICLTVYMCSMCDYQATLQRSPNTHKETIHEGVKYMCTMFDYQ